VAGAGTTKYEMEAINGPGVACPPETSGGQWHLRASYAGM